MKYLAILILSVVVTRGELITICIPASQQAEANAYIENVLHGGPNSFVVNKTDGTNQFCVVTVPDRFFAKKLINKFGDHSDKVLLLKEGVNAEKKQGKLKPKDGVKTKQKDGKEKLLLSDVD